MVDGISWDQLLEQAGDEVPTSYDPLPEDEYELEVVEAKHSKTKTTPSKDMWTVQTKVVENADPKWNNRRLFDRLVLSPESQTSLSIFFQQMGIMGLNRDFFASKPQPDQVATALKGRRFRGAVVQKPYKGEMQNEIKRYKPSRSGSAVAAPPAGAVAAAPTGVPAPPMPGAAPAAPAAPAPPVPPAPAQPAPATPQAAEPQYAAPPAPEPPAPAAAPEAAAPPPPPPLQNLPF